MAGRHRASKPSEVQQLSKSHWYPHIWPRWSDALVETDDPVGVQAYWHRGLAEKWREGEWFALSPEDVNAFKRWKVIL